MTSPQDPRGEKLAAVEDPLAEASKLSEKLLANASDCLVAHVAAFEVAVRQDKPLMALHSVKAAFGLDSESPQPHGLLVRLVKLVEERAKSENGTAGHAIVKAVLDSGVPSEKNFTESTRMSSES